MTKEQFLKYMDIICKKYESLEEMYDNLERFTGIVSDKIMYITSIDPMISMLAEWAGDSDKWIEWYIYDKQCGKIDDIYVKDEDGNIIPSDSYDDIWNLIHITSNEKDNTKEDLGSIGFFTNFNSKGE